jgi:hypothetical protein
VNINWKKVGLKKLGLIVSAELKKNSIDAVLVGGACVSIYTRNRYFSMDLDFVSGFSLRDLEPVMNRLGFKLNGRYFERPDCRLIVEFPPPPVSIGNEFPIKKFNLIKTLTMLTPTDCVKDRLAAYYHWNDPQSLKQALMVARAQPVNFRNIRDWSEKEGSTEKFKRFETLLKKSKKSKQSKHAAKQKGGISGRAPKKNGFQI